MTLQNKRVMNKEDMKKAGLPEELIPLMEQLAEQVHNTWMTSRLEEGWVAGTERSDRLKTHPGLVPYKELPEAEKAYDRNTALATLQFIRKAGFRIEKATNE